MPIVCHLMISLCFLPAAMVAQPPEEQATQPAVEATTQPTKEPATPASKEKEIDARRWFSNPVYRLHDERRAVLFFFRCDDQETVRWVDKLNRLARRRDTIVIGLTPDSPSSAEKFIERRGVRFTVGAGSRSAETFGVRRLPAVRVIDQKDRKKVEELELGAMDAAFPTWKQPLDELNDEPALREYIASDAGGQSRQGAVEKLWKLLEAENRTADFASLAEAQLPIETDPFVRSQMRYFGDLARGIPRNDREMSASTQLYHWEYRANREDPKWAEARAFEAQIQDAAPDLLLSEYRSHLTTGPDDLLKRRLIIEQMADKTAPADADASYKSAARVALMEMLPMETDHSCRLVATMALKKSCEIGDLEAADFLDAMAAQEPNDFTTRPIMEWVAHWLRTGEVRD